MANAVSLSAGGIAMGWFKRAAGWQRLWLLASLAAFAIGVVWLPRFFEKDGLARLAEQRARVVAEFDLPACEPVRSIPYTALPPVPAGAPCHDLYVWRKTVTEKLPLVLNHVLFPMDARRREIWLDGAMKGAALAALISALLYAALYRRYRRRASQQ
jgi:hypothetical protein